MRKNSSKYIGQKINSLQILSIDPDNCKIAICQCDCGVVKKIALTNIVRGGTKSCGCYGKKYHAQAKLSHGQSGTRVYRAWRKIKDRCLNPNNRNYKNYGGRGITICDEWKDSFPAFYEWSMNNGYSDELSIDRINNNGIYEPDNCRWTTILVQMNNFSRNRILKLGGEEFTMSELARKHQINYSTFVNRILKGWTPEEAVSIPVATDKRNKLYQKKNG